MRKLSPHFTLAEAERSYLASRLNIDNRAPDSSLSSLEAVAVEVLEPIKARFGLPFTPNSWYRCPALNRAVGSRPGSQHITGRAVDVELAGVDNRDLYDWIGANLGFDQAILEFYRKGRRDSGWVHVSYVLPEFGVNRNQSFIVER